MGDCKIIVIFGNQGFASDMVGKNHCSSQIHFFLIFIYPLIVPTSVTLHTSFFSTYESVFYSPVILLYKFHVLLLFKISTYYSASGLQKSFI